MNEEPGAGGALDTAISRLDRAVALLEARIAALINAADGANGDLFDEDRAQLAVALDAAKGRERELEAAGQQASIALGRAIAEIRAALHEDTGEEDGGEASEPRHASVEA
jgi:hypothetical protein